MAPPRVAPTRVSPTFEREDELMRLGRQRIIGVDEAGRGPLAGPVVAGAACLSREFARKFEGKINDSKQLSHTQRAALYEQIKTGAAWGVGLCSPAEIDEMNIRRASWEAMRRAIEDLAHRFSPVDYVLVDGLACREIGFPWDYEAIVKGDAKSLSIAAASIIAKVTRDQMMEELDLTFPGYGFAQHKGYPTPKHYATLRELGPCAIHRNSFGPVREAQLRLDFEPSKK